jgi:hypothetical protein
MHKKSYLRYHYLFVSDLDLDQIVRSVSKWKVGFGSKWKAWFFIHDTWWVIQSTECVLYGHLLLVWSASLLLVIVWWSLDNPLVYCLFLLPYLQVLVFLVCSNHLSKLKYWVFRFNSRRKASGFPKLFTSPGRLFHLFYYSHWIAVLPNIRSGSLSCRVPWIFCLPCWL